MEVVERISNPARPKTPDGYRVVETDTAVKQTFPRNYTLRGARARAKAIIALAALPSYHLRIEKHGFMDYRTVPYQNVLEPINDSQENP